MKDIKKRKEILDFIESFHKETGKYPRLKDIIEGLKIKKSLIHYFLKALEAEKVIKKTIEEKTKILKFKRWALIKQNHQGA